MLKSISLTKTENESSINNEKKHKHDAEPSNFELSRPPKQTRRRIKVPIIPVLVQKLYLPE